MIRRLMPQSWLPRMAVLAYGAWGDPTRATAARLSNFAGQYCRSRFLFYALRRRASLCISCNRCLFTACSPCGTTSFECEWRPTPRPPRLWDSQAGPRKSHPWTRGLNNNNDQGNPGLDPRFNLVGIKLDSTWIQIFTEVGRL